MKNDRRFDQQGEPLRFALQFPDGTVGYPFHSQEEAATFLAEQKLRATVVAYTPPTEEEASRLDAAQREASNFYSIPCRFTP